MQVSFVPRVARAALASEQRDLDYYKCWSGLRSHFRDTLTSEDTAATAGAGMNGTASSDASS